MEKQLFAIRQLLEDKKNWDNLRKFEKRIAEVTGDYNFNLKELSPDLLNIIRRYLYVASTSWDNKSENEFMLKNDNSQKKDSE